MPRQFTVRARIEGEDRATPAVRQAEGSFRRLGTYLVSTFAIGIGSVVAATRAMSRAFEENMRLALETQRAVASLNTALRTAGEFSEATSRSSRALADELERTVGVSGDLVLRMNAIALGFTSNAEQAERLTRAALDFSQGAGISFEESTRRLGRTLSGSIEDVAKFETGIRDLSKEALAAGEAIELLGARFEGAARQAADNLAGAYKRLEQAQEAFRKSSVQSAVESVELAQSVDRLSIAYRRHEDAAKALGVVGGALSGLWNRIQGNFLGLIDDGIQTGRVFFGLTEQTQQLTEATEQLSEAQDKSTEATDKRATQLERAREIMEELGATLQQDLLAAEAKEKALLDELHQLYLAGIVDREDLAAATRATAEASAELTPALESEAVALGAVRSETEALTSSQRRLEDQVRRTAETVARTAAQFDAIAASSGRAAAVAAGIAGGGVLSNVVTRDGQQVGGRIRLPGGGSRLIRPGI